MNARTPMPEPGEPPVPDEVAPDTAVERHREEIDDDDLVGFCSPAALQGRVREVESAPVIASPEPDVVPEPVVVAPVFETEPETVVQPVFRTDPLRPGVAVVEDPAPVSDLGSDLGPDPVPAPARAARRTSRFDPRSIGDALPAWARETPVAEQSADSWARRREQPAPIPGAMGLYTTYALILFAVPTLGVSAAIALFGVLTHPAPQDALAASHYRFQKLTLLIGAAAAVVGGVLIAVGLGVIVLFLLSIWLIVRGAGGVLKLKANRPIERPTTWLL